MHLTDHVSDTLHNNLFEWYEVKNERKYSIFIFY